MCARDGYMVRCLLLQTDGQNLPQGQRVGQPPTGIPRSLSTALKHLIIVVRKYKPGAAMAQLVIVDAGSLHFT